MYPDQNQLKMEGYLRWLPAFDDCNDQFELSFNSYLIFILVNVGV